MTLFVRLKHAVHGGEAEFPAATAEAMRGLGWEPVTDDARTFGEAEDEATTAAQRREHQPAEPEPAEAHPTAAESAAAGDPEDLHQPEPSHVAVGDNEKE